MTAKSVFCRGAVWLIKPRLEDKMERATIAVILSLFACGVVLADPQQISIITSYVNPNKEILLRPSDHITFRASTCGQYDSGYNVRVKVDLPLNPNSSLDLGVVLFTVSNELINSSVIPANKTICKVDLDAYSTECVGPAQKGDIYIYTQSNNRPDVNFAVTVTFELAGEQDAPFKKVTKPTYLPAPSAAAAVTELAPVYEYKQPLQLQYLDNVLLRVDICPTSYTGNKYILNSVFQATDDKGVSTIAQAICNNPDCKFDSKYVIGDNIDDLPFNYCPTKITDSRQLWIYAVSFSGPVDPSQPDTPPTGAYKFAATLSK